MAINLAASHVGSNTLTGKGIYSFSRDAGAVAHDRHRRLRLVQIANGATTHAAPGLGASCHVSTNCSVKLNSAIEAPAGSGVQLRDMSWPSPGGVDEITHVLNSRGGAANGSPNSAHFAQ